MLTLSAIIFALTMLNKHRQAEKNQFAIQQQQLRVSLDQVVGPNPQYQGNVSSPYTLVEFGDYECPPCHAVHKDVQHLLKEYPSQLKLVFRNMPLTTIHPFAMQAAVSAESARSQGVFWRVHDELYEIDPEKFNSYSIQKVISRCVPDQKRFREVARTSAMGVIKSDMATAKKLAVNGTPTFILCCPNRKVFRLKSLTQVGSIVGNSTL